MGTPRASWLPETEHLVFLLVDGLGDHLLADLGAGSILSAHRLSKLHAVFPSTTTVALASMATAVTPNQHGMPGWWTYLPSHDLSTIPLPFCERFGNRPLDLDPRLMWPLRPWLETVPAEVLAVSPSAFWNSAFSRYLRGYREGASYLQLEECAALVKAHQQRHQRTFSFVYWPEFDAACHVHGCTAKATREVFTRVDLAAAKLAQQLGKTAGIIVSADHGLLDIPPQGQHLLCPGDPLLDCLRSPPSGEPRTPVFHLKAGREAEFRALFEERFDGLFHLPPPVQIEALLGGPLSALAAERYGDCLGIALSDVVLHYQERPGLSKPSFIGYHGGLTPQEMVVPLIVLA
jgi:hypothetical protein